MGIETTDEFQKGSPGIVERWLRELKLSEKAQESWINRARKVIARYRGEIKGETSFNVLHSNTETLRPNLFAQRPRPDIRRRLKLPGDVDRKAGEILERGIDYMNDTCDYEHQVNQCINDHLLTGRGVLRVRYMPNVRKEKIGVSRETFETDDGTGEVTKMDRFFTATGNEVDITPDDLIEDGEQLFTEIENVTFERSDIEYVNYADFRHTPAKQWGDVRWVAFRHAFHRKQLIDGFGRQKGIETTLTLGAKEGTSSGSDAEREPDLYRRAEVWEIWDKEAREILFISPGYIKGPLMVVKDGPEDGYNLENFFPTVKPLYSIESPDTLEPIPEFTIYQDLADEIDEVTEKIKRVVKGIDVKGVYDSSLAGTLNTMFDHADKMIGVDAYQSLSAKGGLSGVLDFVDINPFTQAFIALSEQRSQLLNMLYQVVGISDITRGASDPRETATAQRLKGQFGQFRLAPRQRAVAQYLRDMQRLQAEIIAEKFSPETLMLISGEEVDEEVLRLLQTDALRNFAVDIETDSTIAVDKEQKINEVRELMESMQAFGNIASVMPEAARLPILQWILRQTNADQAVVLAVEEAANQPPEPDPEAIEAQQKTELEHAKLTQKDREITLKEVDSERDFIIEQEKIEQKRDEAEANVIAQVFSGDA